MKKLIVGLALAILLAGALGCRQVQPAVMPDIEATVDAAVEARVAAIPTPAPVEVKVKVQTEPQEVTVKVEHEYPSEAPEKASVRQVQRAAVPAEAQSCCKAVTVNLVNTNCAMSIQYGEGSKFGTAWDKRANGMVSRVKITGKTTFTFVRYIETKSGHWEPDPRDPYVVTWRSGDYNLQKIFYPDDKRDLNDTLQEVVIQEGTVVLCEHDVAPYGICITLTCPDP